MEKPTERFLLAEILAVGIMGWASFSPRRREIGCFGAGDNRRALPYQSVG